MSESAQKPLSQEVEDSITGKTATLQNGYIINGIKALEAERDQLNEQWGNLLPINHDPCCAECNHSRGCGILKRQKAAEDEVKALREDYDHACAVSVGFQRRLKDAESLVKQGCGNLDCDMEFESDEEYCRDCIIWKLKAVLAGGDAERKKKKMRRVGRKWEND